MIKYLYCSLHWTKATLIHSFQFVVTKQNVIAISQIFLLKSNFLCNFIHGCYCSVWTLWKVHSTGFGWGKADFLHSSSMVLCFGFVTKTVLVTHQWFCRCWTVLTQHQNLLFLVPTWPAPPHHHFTPRNRLGVGEALQGDTAGTADQEEIPCPIMSCSAIN